MNVSRAVYRPTGMALGAVGGLLAGALFRRTWKALGNDDEAPDALDEDRGWQEVLLTAALQGAIFAFVKAAVDRGGAVAVRRLTGTWPG